MVILNEAISWVTQVPAAKLIARADGSGVMPSMLPQVFLANAVNWKKATAETIGRNGYVALLTADKDVASELSVHSSIPVGILPTALQHVRHMDVIRVEAETHRCRVMYKREFRHNSLLLTERCNNYCVMCSQPPRDIDDSYIVRDLQKVLELIPKDACEIGFTGGEPTLLGQDLIELLQHAKNQLPTTSIHVLSNGRKLADSDFAVRIGAVRHHDLMFGIPLYSDNYIDHDYVVQAQGGFSEAVRGIVNLKRAGVKVEIRFVIHQETFSRLPQFAEFVSRNLTFVDQVVFMGYEAMGFGRTNAKHLFVLPSVFLEKLNTALAILDTAGVKTSVYNLPYCLLGGIARRKSVQSISDWKNEYLEECSHCTARLSCCGFFASTKELYRGSVSSQL